MMTPNEILVDMKLVCYKYYSLGYFLGCPQPGLTSSLGFPGHPVDGGGGGGGFGCPQGVGTFFFFTSGIGQWGVDGFSGFLPQQYCCLMHFLMTIACLKIFDSFVDVFILKFCVLVEMIELNAFQCKSIECNCVRLWVITRLFNCTSRQLEVVSIQPATIINYLIKLGSYIINVYVYTALTLYLFFFNIYN